METTGAQVARDAVPDLTGIPQEERGRVEAALALARRLYEGALADRTDAECEAEAERGRMVKDAEGKATLTAMLDTAFRSPSAAVTSRQLSSVLAARGVPGFFARLERTGLYALRWFGGLAPWLSIPAVKAVMRKKTAQVILPGEKDELIGHVRARSASGVRLNVNHLGEMILGEHEAETKTSDDLALLASPDIDCISVKASNLYSQISAIAHDKGVEMLRTRLRPRFRAAKTNVRKDHDPKTAPVWDKGYKLVNLDMEEYRDLPITIDAFRLTLDEPEFLDLQAGIAIQAYIPDSFNVVENLLTWAQARVARGGAPIRIRVVKGANRAMELVDSSVRGLENPTFDEKADTDANWKRIVELISRPEHIAVCHLGIASHNVFDIAWASLLIKERGIGDRCVFEMLEGMANHVQRAVQKELGTVLLYAPAVAPEKFLTAIAYLVRRFDELTDPANFLSHMFGIVPGSPEWNGQAAAFVESIRRMPTVSSRRKRTQDRRNERIAAEPVVDLDAFRNEADTDWTARANREWLQDEVIKRINALRTSANPPRIPLGVAKRTDGARVIEGVRDRSLPEIIVAETELATDEDMRAAVAAAKHEKRWANLPRNERDRILADAAANFGRTRAELIALAALDTGKTFDQADAEISEAVDFGRMYPLGARTFERMKNLVIAPVGGGVVTVISPWNFPIAIPAGGVFAALSAGNRVILKPSTASRLVTSAIAQRYWDAGVPREALQVLNCATPVASALAAHPDVDAVIFTGGTATADRILAGRPGVNLFAETGGKNVTVITGKSDRELAVLHVRDSYRNNGQKCSATSLVCATPDVYNDPAFWSQLEDAVRSIPIGPAHDPASVVTPLAMTPNDTLRRGLIELEGGEEWVVRPERVDGRSDFWTPGLKKGTRRKNFTHMNELFGPVISVMKVKNVDDGIRAAKETGLGLTFGIESLDDREITRAKETAEAGVLYVRRNTVGAVVNRQTFGGWRGSRRGPGIHAGYVNYVTNVMNIREHEGKKGDPAFERVTSETLSDAGASKAASMLLELCEAWDAVAKTGGYRGMTEEMRKAAVAVRSLAYEWMTHFSKDHRPAQDIRGEDNIHRYRPIGTIVVRLAGNDTPFDVITRIMAAAIGGNRVEVSGHGTPQSVPFLRKHAPKLWKLRDVKWVDETDVQLIARMKSGAIHVVRYAHPSAVPETVLAAAASTPACYLSRTTVLRSGRVELLRTMQEQAVSDVYHRYGTGLRAKDIS